MYLPILAPLAHWARRVHRARREHPEAVIRLPVARLLPQGLRAHLDPRDLC